MRLPDWNDYSLTQLEVFHDEILSEIISRKAKLERMKIKDKNKAIIKDYMKAME